MNSTRRRSRWQLFQKRCAGARTRQRIVRLEFLEPRTVLATNLVISEFLAGNNDGLQDADGETNDWIEIYNPTPNPIDLEEWSLTDDPGDLNKWEFPDVIIGANQFLTVFASDKESTPTELHANFKLSASGDYLALVDPTGIVVSEYAPAFPAQLDNISYGIKFDTNELIQLGATTQVLVPANGSLGTTWTSPGFTPTGWTTGTTGVGFGIQHPGFNILYAKANIFVDNLAIAKTVLADPSKRSATVDTTALVVNYMGTGGGGHFGADSAFPTQTINADFNDFVVQATGAVKIPTAGQWTFAVNSDDGFELKLEQNGTVFTSSYPNPRGASDTLATFNLPTAGAWEITMIMYERAGGASVELFAAPGAQGSFNGNFDPIGDTANGGLAVNAPIGAGQGTTIGLDTRTAMQNVNATAYVRVPFTIASPSSYDSLLLSMQYDDGFVAYLNGTEVARRNAPVSLSYNSTATADRLLEEATTAEQISLTPFMHLLQPGTNVLAIQGLNSSNADDSFLVLPQLVASAVHEDQVGYFHTLTPGSPNINPALGIIERVSASVPAGFYNSPITVALSTPSPSATIRYTTNGSEPTATTGTVYTGPITISSTTNLRAGAFRTDYLSMPTITRSYIFLDDVIVQSPSDDVSGGIYPDNGLPPPGWPSSWGANFVDYGMDQTIVNLHGAAAVKSALLSFSTMSITTDLNNLFNTTTGIYANPQQDGRDWERPGAVELINPDGTPGFSSNAGIRIRGGYSRSPSNPKHSFRIFFRGEYGDSTLDYPLFGAEGADSYKKFDLRTAQNYSWSFGGDASNTMIQDGFARQSQGDMGQPYSRSRWVHLYLDGQYWGVYQIEERPEAEFAASYFGGNAEDYDVIKPEAGPYTNYATDGNQDAYQRLWQFVTTQDMSSNANYFRLQGKNAQGLDDLAIPSSDVLLDVDNLIVYMLGILHGGNLDAPISNFLGNNGINNYFAIRDRTGREGFKFIQHDAEHTLHNVNENRNGPYTAGQTFDRFNPQFLHQQLMANADYKLRFGDLVQQFFFGDGPMIATASLARFNADVAALDQAIIGESVRWGDAKRPTSPLGRTNWLSAVATMQGFLNNRNPVLLSQFVANGLFPATTAAQYLVNGVPRDSGDVIPGSILRLFAPAGLVYYTTDGSDPRLPGGGINPTAQVYDPSQTVQTLLPLNSSWKYRDVGVDLGTTWRNPSFNDASWASGNAELGYGDGDEATVLSYGPDINNRYITTYFRKTFSVTDPASVVGLKLRLKRDDGAVVFINGVEAHRNNMPTGTITAATLATVNVNAPDESTIYEFDINPALLQAGTNLIAVELHQAMASSSDISFDASLVATVHASAGIVMGDETLYKARALNNTVWSPLSDANFSSAVPATAANLTITEVHYNPEAMEGASTLPLSDKQNFEFVELRNISSQAIELAGVEFTNGISFNFSDGAITALAPGQFVVVVKDLVAFQTRYGSSVAVAGVYTGSLDNGGEQLRLETATGAIIKEFSFDDNPLSSPPWPTTPDGGGPSLTVRGVTGNYNLGSNWRASYELHGTPGSDEQELLSVSNLTPTTTGFVVDFNREIDSSVLNLYDSSLANLGPADIVLQGATAGSIRGSVQVEANLRRFTFIATVGQLAADTYTVTLRSSASAFRDSNLSYLDGDHNDMPGGDFVQTFVMTAPAANAVTVSIPNFSRGPLQPVNLPADGSSGVPVSFSNGGGVTSANFEMRYNPALLTILGASVAPGLPSGSSVSLNTSTPGLVVVQFSSPSPLASGTTRFMDLQLVVPSTAPYRSKQVLDIANITLNGGSLPAVDDDGLQVVAYFGDVSANGSYSAQDASFVSRMSVGIDSGLAAFALLDPVIVGDVTGNGSHSALDVSRMLQAAVGIAVPEIPSPLPNVSLLAGGPDPKLSIPRQLSADPGQSLIIPVEIDSIVDLTGVGFSSADLVIYYDPTVLEISTATLGRLLAGRSGWMISSRIDALAGRIDISLAGAQPLEGKFIGELVQLPTTVNPNAKAGEFAINLAATSRSRQTQLNEGFLTLIPAPTDAANDSIDGLLTIRAAANAPPTFENRARLVGEQLLVTGSSQNDRILVGQRSDGRLRVRVGHELLGEFLASSVAVNSLGGDDFVFFAPTASAAIVSADLDDRDLIFGGTNALAVHADAPPASNHQNQAAGNLRPEDLALLSLLSNWTSEFNDGGPAGRSSSIAPVRRRQL